MWVGTSLDDIRAGTATSKSQLFHYFPQGKGELVGAIAAFQSQRVLDAQRPFLDSLDTWEAWDGWRDAVLAHYCSQSHWGCPIGSLVGELVGRDRAAAQVPAIWTPGASTSPTAWSGCEPAGRSAPTPSRSRWDCRFSRPCRVACC